MYRYHSTNSTYDTNRIWSGRTRFFPYAHNTWRHMSYSLGQLWYRFKFSHLEFLQAGTGFRQAHIEPTLGVF